MQRFELFCSLMLLLSLSGPWRFVTDRGGAFTRLVAEIDRNSACPILPAFHAARFYCRADEKPAPFDGRYYGPNCRADVGEM